MGEIWTNWSAGSIVWPNTFEKRGNEWRDEGKVALISGGAYNQGAAEARRFAEVGAKVVFGDIADEAGKAVEAEIKAARGDAHYRHLDVTSADE